MPARPLVVATALLGLIGCYGESSTRTSGSSLPSLGLPDEPPISGVPGELSACTGQETLEPGPTVIRRLNRVEFDNTVLDLFGATLLGNLVNPAKDFPPEEVELGFDNNGRALTVTPRLAEDFMKAAEAISRRVTEQLPTLLNCDPAVTGEAVCARQFAQSFGVKAWRRPLAAAELTRLMGVYNTARASSPFAASIQRMIEVFLQSPRFLYRVELGVSESGTRALKLDSWEVASRLSYLLWESMPDAALIAAARAGELTTRDQVSAQARRMLKDPRNRHRRMVSRFHSQWLGLEDLDSVEKDPTLFPEFAATLPLLRQESEIYFDRMIWEENANLRTLLTSPTTYLSSGLAAFYGVGGPSTSAFERVTLDPSRRAGFLTQGGLLALNSNPNQTNPVRRGLLIREQLLCNRPPPPPDNVDIKPPDPSPELTTRERFAEHRSNALCAGCHALMDPLGLPFEHFDAVGKWQDIEAGKPIDATGEIKGTDVDGPVNGAVELVARLAESRQVRRCAMVQWFRFSHGRAETEAEACNLEKLEKAFVASSLSIPELLVAITQTDAFLYRPAPEGVAP
jgi:hypothetical protein